MMDTEALKMEEAAAPCAPASAAVDAPSGGNQERRAATQNISIQKKKRNQRNSGGRETARQVGVEQRQAITTMVIIRSQRKWKCKMAPSPPQHRGTPTQQKPVRFEAANYHHHRGGSLVPATSQF